MEYVLAGISVVSVVGLACVATYAIRAISRLSTEVQDHLLAATNLGAAGFLQEHREQVPKIPSDPVKRKSLN